MRRLSKALRDSWGYARGRAAFDRIQGEARCIRDVRGGGVIRFLRGSPWRGNRLTAEQWEQIREDGFARSRAARS